MSGTDVGEQYSRYTSRRILLISLFIAILILLAFVSLGIGTRSLSFGEVYSLLYDHLTGVRLDKATQYDRWFDDNIVWTYRLPRTIFAILAGASLAVAGAAMQSVMKNPLADPYTTGISSGALLGVSLSMVLGFNIGGGGADGTGVILNAIIFAMVPAIAIYVMAPFLNSSPSTLILAGVAVSYMFNSLTDVILVSTDELSLSEVYTWQVGSMAELSWDAVPLVLITTIAGAAILMIVSNKLNLMSLDDKDARSLGLDSEQLRLVCLMLLSFMVSAVISYTGIIGFVGLIIPHIVRLMIGSDNRFVIPASVVVGAAFLLGCDIFSRAIDMGSTVPVGVVTALIGSPIFLFLVLRSRRAIWRCPPNSSATASASIAGGGAEGCFGSAPP